MSSDELRKRLREIGYSEEAIQEILGFYEQGAS
jgi:SOS response regulatory protein OraA/RecX